MRSLNTSKKATLGAMVVALNLLCLYAGTVLPWGNIACFFLSSVFIFALTREDAYGTAWIAFLATSLLSFFLLPDKRSVLYYVLLLGHYGVFKTWMDYKAKNRFLRMILKLLYCDLWAAIGIYLAVWVFKLDVLSGIPELPAWVLVVLAQIAFLAWDWIFGLCIRIYNESIRKHLVPKR